jgi:tetratricopeptide (TPR) repeat protein
MKGSFVMAMRLTIGAVLMAAVLGLGGCKTANQTFREEGELLFAQARAAEDAKNDADADAKYASALIAFDKSLADNSQDPVSNAFKAAIHYRASEFEVACYYAHVAMQFDPSNDLARTVMIRSRVKQGKPDLAIDALERRSGMADKINDPRPDISNIKRMDRKESEMRLFFSPVSNRYEIGRVYESLGDFDNAALWYRNALSLRPEDVTVLMAVVKLNEKTRNDKGLRAAMQAAYAVDPANGELLEAMKRNGISISQISPPK